MTGPCPVAVVALAEAEASLLRAWRALKDGGRPVDAAVVLATANEVAERRRLIAAPTPPPEAP